MVIFYHNVFGHKLFCSRSVNKGVTTSGGNEREQVQSCLGFLESGAILVSKLLESPEKELRRVVGARAIN